MGKITLTLAILSSILAYSPKCLADDFQDLISGQKAPLTKQLKDLNESWRQIAISGQYEMADLMKSWTSIFGINSYNNIYYTQGKTVIVNDESYVVAYRLPISDQMTMQSFMENIMSLMGGLTGSDCDEIGTVDKITPQTNLQLSLLNLKTIGSLNDIRPFNLESELAAAEKIQQQSQATCEQIKIEKINSEVESDLRELGIALQSYADQHQGKLPKMNSSETVKEALGDLVYDPAFFVHPETIEPYLPNPALSNKTLVDINNPTETVTFYESKPAADGTIGVVFADGYYERLSPEDWEVIKKSSKLP